MKSLIQMFTEQLDKQPENKPSLPDILFLSAFPNENIKSKTKELSRLSEDLFEEFNEAWTTRFKEGVENCLKEDMPPQLVMNAVPFLTRDELRTVMQKVDEFLPGDTDEVFALKISELQNQFNNFMITATEILKQMYQTHMIGKQQKKIISGPEPGKLVDSIGMPIN